MLGCSKKKEEEVVIESLFSRKNRSLCLVYVNYDLNKRLIHLKTWLFESKQERIRCENSFLQRNQMKYNVIDLFIEQLKIIAETSFSSLRIAMKAS